MIKSKESWEKKIDLNEKEMREGIKSKVFEIKWREKKGIGGVKEDKVIMVKIEIGKKLIVEKVEIVGRGNEGRKGGIEEGIKNIKMEEGILKEKLKENEMKGDGEWEIIIGFIEERKKIVKEKEIEKRMKKKIIIEWMEENIDNEIDRWKEEKKIEERIVEREKVEERLRIGGEEKVGERIEDEVEIEERNVNKGVIVF